LSRKNSIAPRSATGLQISGTAYSYQRATLTATGYCACWIKQDAPVLVAAVIDGNFRFGSLRNFLANLRGQQL
jgi:hypothetical protein